jgi:hypothetical protein
MGEFMCQSGFFFAIWQSAFPLHFYENAVECPALEAGGFTPIYWLKRLKFVQKYEKFEQKLSTSH